ncbi:MAG: DUF2726 domain-containing protein [Litoreibacter sp.]|uniref:DUF2726 domain-containing protein n=1 Tax=Litoreibacter sp. TaxID=1969459 RepID=UPI0032993422
MLELIIGATAGAGLTYFYLKHSSAKRRKTFEHLDVKNTDNQIRFIENARLQSYNPIKKMASKVFSAIEGYLPKRTKRYRLLAEVSMGAFIKTDRSSGNQKQQGRVYSSYGSKRVEFLIIDALGKPAVAIEYHGGETRYRNNGVARDAIKKRVLQKAGIELLEVHRETEKDDYLLTLSRILDRHENLS